MNIVYIVPLADNWESIISAGKSNSNWSIGALHLASYSKKHHPDINQIILDMNLLINEFFVSPEYMAGVQAKDFYRWCLGFSANDVDVFALTANFNSYGYEFAGLCQYLRDHFIDSTIVAGGHFAMQARDKLLSQLGKSLDAICFGVGEIPFEELLQSKAEPNRTEHYLASSPYWVTHQNVIEGFQPSAAQFVEPDEIPPFDLDIVIHNELYQKYAWQVFSTNKGGGKTFTMMTSFGCPYSCVFCAIRNIQGRKVRAYSLKRVKDDIRYYADKYGFERINFLDDHFLYNKQRFIDLMSYCREQGIQTAITNLSFFSIDDDIAACMKMSGIDEITIAAESGNNDTLKNIINKHAGVETVKKAIEILHKHQILIQTNIILGFPGETKEAIELSISGAESYEADWYSIYVAAPLFGTELFDICEKNGYLVEKDMYKLSWKYGIIKTVEFDPEYIEDKVYETNLLLNFVRNNNIRQGKFDVALMYFERMLDKVLPDHAFALYYAADCYHSLGDVDKARECRTKYFDIVANQEYWRDWADRFKLPLKETTIF